MNTLQQEQLIEESLKEFDKHFGDTELRNKTVGYDAPRRIKIFLRKELELIAKKSAATAREDVAQQCYLECLAVECGEGECARAIRTKFNLKGNHAE